jgi:hypothetical protein
MVVGASLGILVGIVSGAAFILIVNAAKEENALKAAATLLTMPTTWFGGGWLTQVFDLERILDAYVVSLAVSMLVICGVSLWEMIVRHGNQVGEAR